MIHAYGMPLQLLSTRLKPEKNYRGGIGAKAGKQGRKKVI